MVARKPLSESSVARNVLEHGTGALNIDGSRIRSGGDSELNDAREELDLPRGRWPANVLISHHELCQRVGVKRVRGSLRENASTAKRHDVVSTHFTQDYTDGERGYGDPDGFEEVEAWECVEGCPVAELDRQSGTSKSIQGKQRGAQPSTFVVGGAKTGSHNEYNDQGGASRFFLNLDGEPGFFYCAKSSRSERNGFTKSLPRTKNQRKRYQQDRSGRWLKRVICNHPTVKPLSLMRYLVKLVTPPGGVVLDPFAGSGTTGVACVELGFDFIGIEQEEEYAQIAAARCRAALEPSVVNLATKRATNADTNPLTPTGTQGPEAFSGTLF